MRTAFINALMECAAADETIWLLCGDLGYSVLEPFAKRFPERFINVGVAEQNMVGVATGLALNGNKVICYSIGNFATLRCFEQIRNDICYHDANVKVVSVGGGLVYGSHGYTHHTIEDLGVMRTLPNLAIIAPGDPVEVRLATKWMLKEFTGPCYLRIGKAGETIVHQNDLVFTYGRMIEIRQGRDVLLISTGGVLELALNVAAVLETQNIKAGVASCPFFKPLDSDYLLEQASRYHVFATLEEHTRYGGLSEAVAGVLAMAGARACLSAHYVPELALKGIGGNHASMLARAGLTPAAVVSRLLPMLERKAA